MIGYLLGTMPLPARTCKPRRITPMADAEKRPYAFITLSAAERRSLLLDELIGLGEATTNSLAEWLGVYPKTIVDVLSELHKQGQIECRETFRGATRVRHWSIKESKHGID